MSGVVAPKWRVPAALVPAERMSFATRTFIDRVVLLFGAAIFTISSVAAIHRYAAGLGTAFFDWTFYSGAVNRWMAGEPIYPSQQISTLGAAAGSSYAYPPASVPLMLPFASWPFGAVLWETVIVGSLLIGLLMVVRVGWPERTMRAYGIAVGAMALVSGVMEGVGEANVNIATAGVLGFAWARSRGTPEAIGAMTVIKVFPLSLAATFGRTAFLRSLSLAALVCAATLPLVGVNSWIDYVEGLRASHPLCGDPQWANQALACRLEPFVDEAVAKWAGLLAAFACVLLSLRAGPTLLGLTFAAGAILAPATELHAHYWAIVYVLVVIAIATLRREISPAMQAFDKHRDRMS
jgi:hypothetical protein